MEQQSPGISSVVRAPGGAMSNEGGGDNGINGGSQERGKPGTKAYFKEPMFYAVGYTVLGDKMKQQYLTVTSIDWMILETDYFHHPPNKTINKKILKNPPKPDPDTWIKYKCDMSHGPYDYYPCSEKIKEWSESSGSEEECALPRSGKRPSRPPWRYTPTKQNDLRGSDSGDGTETSEDESPSRKKSKTSIKPSASDVHKTSRKIADNDSEDSDASMDLEIQQARKKSKAVRRKRSGNVVSSSEHMRIMETGFKTLHKQMMNLGARVEGMAPVANANRDEYNILPNFPLKDGEEVAGFEGMLSDANVRTIFKKWLKDIGGKNASIFVRNIFAAIMVPKLHEKFSMTGQKTKKLAFVRMKICAVIKEAVHECGVGTQAKIRSKIMIKLQYAKDDNERAEEGTLALADIARLLA
ncbi:hypothetical protein QAD02_013962 [Eretmocerus hayati]|uniref:Uncharacterized protein n=1 Tax=Eretmocerus hayati TaxID=131215 RepID=A0ACC2P3L2_9HYME|nr:hypothetical protein QAD02_013962 [Eretmocerus hayati]